MARNGSGTYNLPAGNPVTTASVISSTWANNTLDDVATALTGSLAKDGQTTPSANLPMGTYKHTGVGAATTRTDYARASQVQDGELTHLTSVSGVDTITAAAPISMTAYATGQKFSFVAAGANTGAVTININSIGAKDVTRQGSTALSAGNIANGATVVIVYDGTRFQLVAGGSFGNGDLVAANNLSDVANAATARANLGVAIGSDVQAYDAQTSKDNTARTQTIWVPANAMKARTTNGAATGSTELTTNKEMVETLDFDASTAEYAQFAINMPKSWDEGTMTAVFVWSHAATTTNFGVAWELAAVAFADDDAMDTAFGTAVTVTDTGGTTSDCYITSASSAMTVAGSPGANELVYFQVNRAPSNGSDTMAIDARLHGVRLMYAINTLTDA